VGKVLHFHTQIKDSVMTLGLLAQKSALPHKHSFADSAPDLGLESRGFETCPLLLHTSTVPQKHARAAELISALINPGSLHNLKLIENDSSKSEVT
jgi:hypothetical protein